jgi:hypothetical protein
MSEVHREDVLRSMEEFAFVAVRIDLQGGSWKEPREFQAIPVVDHCCHWEVVEILGRAEGGFAGMVSPSLEFTSFDEALLYLAGVVKDGTKFFQSEGPY